MVVESDATRLQSILKREKNTILGNKLAVKQVKWQVIAWFLSSEGEFEFFYLNILKIGNPQM